MIKDYLRKWLFEDTGKNNKQLPDLTNDSRHISICNTIGGKIIEFRRYDKRLDKQYLSRYIISDGADFEQSLAKLINLEDIRG